MLKAVAKAANWQTRPSPGAGAKATSGIAKRPRRRNLAARRHLQRRGRRGRGRPQDGPDPRQPHRRRPGQRPDDQPARGQARNRGRRRADGRPHALRAGHVRPLERHEPRLARLPDHPLQGRADRRGDPARQSETCPQQAPASRPSTRSRRRSATRCSTRPACACAACR